MPPFEIIHCTDPLSLFQYAAGLFSRLSRDAVFRSGRFAVALSGGSTPRGLYGQLAAEPYRSQIAWEKVHFFWSDERCVPPEHPDSNYGMAWEALLSRVFLHSSNIHRPAAEDADPARAAEAYEREIRAFFEIGPQEFPRFDLVLLGMGDDGHTASLFPDSPALGESQRIFVANHVAKLNTNRLTLTFPAINSAAQVAVLVSGKKKAPVLREVLQGPVRYPIQHVSPSRGRLLFVTDEDALSTK